MSSVTAADDAAIPARAGIGLRFVHHARAVTGDADANWFEVHAENYLHDERAREELRAVRRRRPLSIHGVGLSLGSAHGLDVDHLAAFCDLVQELRPGLVSDHLSWSRTPELYLPDLLPLPYDDDSLSVVCRNVDQAQRALSRTLLIENPSTYVEWAGATHSEARFLAALAQRTGCGVLLDVNNVYVSACNRGLDPRRQLDEYFECIDPRRIGELHLAGHTSLIGDHGRVLRVDDHGASVCAEVWSLYERTLATLGPRPTLLEWDTRIPAFEILADEAAHADACMGFARVAAG